MEFAFTPGFLGRLGKLPVIEPWPEPGRHQMGLLGPIIVTKPVIGQPQGLWQHPAFAIVLTEKGLDPFITIPAASRSFLLEVVECH